jgi:hypothetical protein
MKALLLVMMFALLAGCTQYTISKRMADGSTVDVKVVSSREFVSPEIHYKRVGDNAEFDFGAESVTTYDPSAEIISGILSGRIVIKPDNQ